LFFFFFFFFFFFNVVLIEHRNTMDKHALHFTLIFLALIVFTKLSFDALIIGTAALFIIQIKGIKL